MKPVIRSLTLKGFRSISAERVEFDNPTFLVGVNGSGKSNVLDALAFLADAMRRPLPEVIAKRKGLDALLYQASSSRRTDRLGLKVEFGKTRRIRGGHYGFEIRPSANRGFEVIHEQCRITGPTGETHWFDRKRDTFVSSVSTIALPLEPDWLALPLMGGHKGFAPIFQSLLLMEIYAIDPARLRERQESNGGNLLWRDGSNVASILQDLEERAPEQMTIIDEFLSVLMPLEVHVKIAQRGEELSLEFDQKVDSDKILTLEAVSMPDGTLRVLGLLAAAFQKNPLALMAIEEPETSVHPGRLGVVLDILQIASKRSQVIITTHSPELLEAKWIESRHLRIVDWHDGKTRVIPISEASRYALEQRIMGAGEMLRSDLLDASRSRIPETFSELQLFEEIG